MPPCRPCPWPTDEWKAGRRKVPPHLAQRCAEVIDEPWRIGVTEALIRYGTQAVDVDQRSLRELVTAGGEDNALVVANLNGDARVDVVVGHVEAPSAVYFNDGTERSYRAVRFGDDKGTAYVFAIGDVNKDGVMDIGVARSEAANVVFFGARR